VIEYQTICSFYGIEIFFIKLGYLNRLNKKLKSRENLNLDSAVYISNMVCKPLDFLVVVSKETKKTDQGEGILYFHEV